MDILNAIMSGRSVFDIAHQSVVEDNDGRPIVETEEDEPEVTVETTEEPVDAEKKEESAPVENKEPSTVANSKPKADEKKPEKEAKASETKALPPAGTTNRLYANVFYNFVDRKSVPKMRKEVFNRIAKRVYNLFTNQGFVTAYPYMYHNGYNFVAINLESKLPAFELCSVHTLPNGKKYMKVILFTEDENSNNIFPDSTTWFTADKENKLVKENVPYGGMTPCGIYYSLMGVKDNRDPALAVNETA